MNKARIEPQKIRNAVREVSQSSNVDWIGVGILPLLVPAFGSQVGCQWIVAVAVVAYVLAVGNAMVTRGRHPGPWFMGVVALALIGLRWQRPRVRVSNSAREDKICGCSWPAPPAPLAEIFFQN